MKTLHTYGCSLTYGCELPGQGIAVLEADQCEQTWSYLLSNKLNYDRCIVHARNGASNRDIVFTALEHMLANPTHDHMIAWTYNSRLNRWDIKPSANHANHILSDHNADSVYNDQQSHWEASINHLQLFHTIETTAQHHNIQLTHIQVGANNYYTDQHTEWLNNQTVPHSTWSSVITCSVTNAKLVNHPLWQTWINTPVHFREYGLYSTLLDYWIKNDTVDKNINGTHWSAAGHVDATKAVHYSLTNTQFD